MYTIIGGDGNEYGPVEAAEIIRWIAAGRANLQTKARRAGESDWRTLGDFPELQSAPPPIAGVPPAVPPVAATQSVAVTQPVAVDNLASPWIRLGAALIDSCIAFLCVLPGLIILFAMGALASNGRDPNPIAFITGFSVCGIGLLIIMCIQIYLLSTRGQTVGKKIVGIKIVTFDTGENPGFVKAFLLRAFVNGLIGAVPWLGMLYSLVDNLFIFREDHRCIRDLIAGTKVVTA